MIYFYNQNRELMRKMWMSLNLSERFGAFEEYLSDKGTEIKGKTAKRAKSIIQLDGREEARAFQYNYDRHMQSSASQHFIPYKLLAAIIFTEMNYDATSLDLDNFISYWALIKQDKASLGPGQVQTSHLKEWGYEGTKWELANRLKGDVAFAIDASARFIFELIYEYMIKEIKKINSFLMRFLAAKVKEEGRNLHKNRKLAALIKSETLHRSAWPVIAGWYNGGKDNDNPGYRSKFTKSLNTLEF